MKRWLLLDEESPVTEQSPHDRLNVEKQATVGRIESLVGDLADMDAGMTSANADDEHDPEGSTLAFERARISTLLNRDCAYLEEIDQARDRLADGTYGTCEGCGAAIPRERLAALPVVRRCLQCRSTSCWSQPAYFRTPMRTAHPNG